MKAILQHSWKFLLCLGLVFFVLETQPAQAATPIESGQTLSGSLAVSETDIYEFYGEAGDRILIDAETTAGSLNTEICLINPDLVDEVACQADDFLDHVLEKTGAYTILVQDYGLDHTGSYNITLINLTAGPLTSSGDPDGGSVASGEMLSGTITASDMDVFQFYGKVGDRVLIDAETTAGSLNTEICLINPDLVDEVACQAEDLLDHVLEKTGTYTILVQDAGLNHTGNYNITLINLTAGPLTSSADPDGGPIASGETLSGTIAVSGMDVFQFYGEAGDRVLIDAETTSGHLNTEICLIDPDQIDEVPCQAEDLLDHVLERTGTYTILVQDYRLDHTGSYDITLMNLTAGPPDPVASGQTLSGTITVSDMDVFQFYGEAGDRVLIDAETTSGHLNTEICLIDPDQIDEVPCQAEDLLDHVLEKTGTYTILVQDAGLNHTGNYNITLINFTAGGGRSITSGQTLSGTIAVSGMDVFQFYGEAGDRVLIDAETTSGSLNTEICLIDPDQIDEVPCQAEDLLDHVLERTGTYTILVQDYRLDHTGSYNITLLKLPGAPSSPGDSDGSLMKPEDILSGTITASDMDVFQFYGEAGDRVLIDAETTAGSLNTEICLIDPDQIDEVPCQAEDRLDHFLLKSGLYTIVVQDVGLNHTGNYKITLNKFPPDLRPGIYSPDPAGTCDISNDPTLTWDAVADATGYDVFFGTNVLEPLQKVGDNVPSPNFPLTDLNYGTVYYWTVVAHTPAGEIPGTVNWFVTHYYIMELTAGWSMISLPVVPESLVLKDVFPEAVVVYGYERNAGYVRVKARQELEVGKGYWILLNEERTYALTGAPIHEHTGSVKDGWYIIGGCTDPAQVIPYGCDIGVIYGFNQGAGYQRVPESERLEAGQGYWILINNATEATISVETVD